MNNNQSNIRKRSISTPNLKNFNEKKFICDLYDCEKAKYILEERLDELDYLLDDLGTDKKNLVIPKFGQSLFRKEYDKEAKRLQKYPKKPIKPVDNRISLNIGDTIFVFIVSSIIAVIALYIIGFLNEIIICNIIQKIIGSSKTYENISEWILIIIAVIAPIAITYILCFDDVIEKRSNYNKAIAKYETEMQKYKSACEKIDKNNAVIKEENQKLLNLKAMKYNEWVEKEKADYLIYSQQYDAEVSTKQHIFENEIQIAESKLSEVEYILKTLYSMRINDIACIHPNYQGLIPISVIYGYFDTGRCSSLRGYEGAYNLYEDEKIKGIIINQLDEIITELTELNATMHYVAIAITSCEEQLNTLNRNMENLIEETSQLNSNFTESMHEMNSKMMRKYQNMNNYAKQIEINTANSAYYSEISAKMSALNTFYSVYKDL